MGREGEREPDRGEPAQTETERVASCPVCRTARPARRWRAAEFDVPGLGRRTFEWYRCVCGACVQDSRLQEQRVGLLYPEEYAPYDTAPLRADDVLGAPAHASSRGFTGRLQAELLAVYLRGEGKSLLDFGCGSGRTLSAAATRGWEGTGVDFTEPVVQGVRAAGHTGMLVEELWRQPATPTYDVIRLNHVVEHLYDPPDVLAQLVARLRPGGVLHLATPNPAGLSSRLTREHWFALEPRHTVMFPARTLRQLLLSLGLGQVSVFPESVSKDLVRSAAAMAPRLGSVPGRAWTALASTASRLGLYDRFHVFARH